jgi:protein-S-isoprenylcysteine O-methyltransferase Ste14
MFSRIRHPNYLGEMLIYGSFALIVHHWIPWAILAWVWLGYFWVNILMKERSMSRYAEWEEYRARSNYLIPHIF